MDYIIQQNIDRVIIQFKRLNKQIRMPNTWQQQPSNNHSNINFDELFDSPNFNAMELLTLNNILQQCRKQNQKITIKLIKNHVILEDLMEICFRPTYYQQNKGLHLTTEHTFKALEILNNLSQEFSDYLLSNNQQKVSEDDNVITQQPTQNNNDRLSSCNLVTFVFKILHDEPKPLPETALSYMFKISSTSLCYQKPKQVVNLFAENKQICLDMFNHFYSNSILQWLMKLLEIEDSTSFFENEKVVIFKNFIQSLNKIQQSPQQIQLKLNRLQNYQFVLSNFLQKMEDRFDKSKYLSLVKLLYSDEFAIQFIVEAMNNIINQKLLQLNQLKHQDTTIHSQIKLQQSQEQQQIFNVLLNTTQKYLHFGSNYKTNIANSTKLNNISTQSKSAKGYSSQNINNGFDGSSSALLIDICLDSKVTSKIRLGVKHFSDYLVRLYSHGSQIQVFHLISYLRLLRTVVVTNEQSQALFIFSILTYQFTELLLKLIKIHSTNNILHNLVRDIILDALNKNYYKTVQILLYSQSQSFINLISQIKGKNNASQNQYQNQIYHIFQIILKKGQIQSNLQTFQQIKQLRNFDQILQNIKQKQKLYNTLICGNPRKLSGGWDQDQDLPFTFNNPNEQGERKIQEQRILSPSAANNNNDAILGNVQHFVDTQLPLDSDSSKDEIGCLQTSGVLQKQQVKEVYNPTILPNIQQSIQRKQKNQPFVSELVKKFKNIGVVECQEQQFRIPVKQQRYGLSSPINKVNQFNFGIFPNSPKSPKSFFSSSNLSGQFGLATSNDLSRQNEQIFNNVLRKSRQLRQKPKGKQKQVKQVKSKQDKQTQKQSQKDSPTKQTQIKDKQQLELERQIKILQNKRLHREQIRQSNEQPQIEIRLKKNVDSIEEERVLVPSKIANISNSNININDSNSNENTQSQISGISKRIDSGDLGLILDQSQDRDQNNSKQHIGSIRQKISAVTKLFKQKQQKMSSNKKLGIQELDASEASPTKIQHQTSLSQFKQKSFELKEMNAQGQESEKAGNSGYIKNKSKSKGNQKQVLTNGLPKYLDFQIDLIFSDDQ